MTTAPLADERVATTSTLTRLLKRPEIGALVAAIAIFAFFAVSTDVFATPSGASTWLRGASTIGIMAVAVALLMIGGEFDLSAGAITGASAVMVALMTTSWLKNGSNIWLAVIASFIACAGIGWWNGTMVNKTGLPRFIVTLCTLFALQGAKLGFAK